MRIVLNVEAIFIVIMDNYIVIMDILDNETLADNWQHFLLTDTDNGSLNIIENTSINISYLNH